MGRRKNPRVQRNGQSFEISKVEFFLLTKNVIYFKIK
jgi:hypothetical protein